METSALIILIIASAFRGAVGQFAAQPVDVAAVAPGTVGLVCEISELPMNDSPRWYRYVGIPAVKEELWNMRENRFFITGNRNAGEYHLFINSTRVEDSGLYSCSYGGSSTRNATLTVLPTSWLPVCQKVPVDKRASAGVGIDILCTSRGSASTVLQWFRNDVGMVPSERNVNGTTVNIAYFEVIPSDVAITFTCEATVPGLLAPQRCVLGPYPEADPGVDASALIPFIIVGILSMVVILLFIVVLYILFRHRRCRFCQRELPEPQMVLDAAAIAAGHGFPTVIADIDDEDDIGDTAAPDSALSDNQPDLLSSIHVRTKSPNSTLRENMERGKRGAMPEKKVSEIEKLRPSEISRIKKKRSPSGSSRVENVETASAPSDADVRSGPSPVSLDLNVTPRSQPASPLEDQANHSRQGTSSNDPGTSPINDLDASVGRKNRFAKKKSTKKSSSSNPTTPTTSPRNIMEPSASSGASTSTNSRQADTIIYAELDWSKNVGMNILGDEQL